MYVGWDWASASHDVTVVDEAGEIVDHWAFSHSEIALQGILAELAKVGEPTSLEVAIERPSGLVVERLLEAGHLVVPVHPNAFNATRPRWGASRAKSDPGDSYRLADLLRTDGHRMRRLRPLDQATRELQALCRTRDDHVEAKVAATNQLQALLDAHWPGAAAIFARLDSDIALEFLDRYPTPESASRLGEQRLRAHIEQTSEQDLDRVYAVNVKGVALCCKHGIPAIIQAGGGSVINIASFVALVGCTVPQDAYTASKGAVIALTKSLAVQFGPKGVRSNAVCPGPIETPLMRDLLKDEKKKSLRMNRIPLGRFGQAQDVVNMAVYLASDESTWTNGAALVIDGGITSNYF